MTVAYTIFQWNVFLNVMQNICRKWHYELQQHNQMTNFFQTFLFIPYLETAVLLPQTKTEKTLELGWKYLNNITKNQIIFCLQNRFFVKKYTYFQLKEWNKTAVIQIKHKTNVNFFLFSFLLTFIPLQHLSWIPNQGN